MREWPVEPPLPFLLRSALCVLPSDTMPPMRILFMGTPDFAVPTLDAIAREHEVVLVVAQPDKPSGRGMKMHAPAVAVHAREIGLPVLQPARIRNDDVLAEMARTRRMGRAGREGSVRGRLKAFT